MKVAILYNVPGEGSSRSKTEMAAEVEVLETVALKERGLERAGRGRTPPVQPEALFALKNFDLVFNLAEGFLDDPRGGAEGRRFIELLGVLIPDRRLELWRWRGTRGSRKLLLAREWDTDSQV